MNQRLRELMDNIPEHIDRSVHLYVALLKKVNNLQELANEETKLELDKLMSSDKFYFDLRNIAKLESILGVHLIEVV